MLVPELRPGDVVVFDSLKPHLSRHVAESIERAGATVLPLPPYNSDYDPIEELWSKFEGQLRRIAARTKDGSYKAIGETLDSVTIQDILGWLNQSGMYAKKVNSSSPGRGRPDGPIREIAPTVPRDPADVRTTALSPRICGRRTRMGRLVILER